MDMSQAEENRAMRIYLAESESRRYDPAGRDQRLRREYGGEWRSVQKALDDYLQPLLSRSEDWSRETIEESAAKMNIVIEECFPWFDEETRGLMVDCFIYEWK